MCMSVCVCVSECVTRNKADRKHVHRPIRQTQEDVLHIIYTKCAAGCHDPSPYTPCCMMHIAKQCSTDAMGRMPLHVNNKHFLMQQQSSMCLLANCSDIYIKNVFVGFLVF